MEIRIYRDTKQKKVITVNEESLETAQKRNARGEYALLWESAASTDYAGEEYNFVKLPPFDNAEIAEVGEHEMDK